VDNLSEEQKAVLDLSGEPVLVQAGPGSGKTRTLVAKFRRIASNGTSG
jgi:superfamily I DNA/RNA helicase